MMSLMSVMMSVWAVRSGMMSLMSVMMSVQGSEVAHPGVAPQDPGDRTEHVYHRYYQWVCYVLALQVQ